MKIIVLDFDGVLAPYNSSYVPEKFSKSCVDNFNKILKAVPEAKIVVSSSWRLHGIKYIKHMLDDNGIDGSKVVGMTPDGSSSHTFGSTREEHIHQYLVANKNVKKFVIIDDDHADKLKDFWVKPNSHIGLTQSDVEEAIRILNE